MNNAIAILRYENGHGRDLDRLGWELEDEGYFAPLSYYYDGGVLVVLCMVVDPDVHNRLDEDSEVVGRTITWTTRRAGWTDIIRDVV